MKVAQPPLLPVLSCPLLTKPTEDMKALTEAEGNRKKRKASGSTRVASLRPVARKPAVGEREVIDEMPSP
jgi:hypothetical protein